MIKEFLDRLPNTNGAVVVLSGGMDSTTALRLAVEKYGKENVFALTFFYGQKQSIEIEKAKESTTKLGVFHKVLDITFLKDISTGFSANVDPDIAMPTIKEVLGAPRPPTYVPNRNMILMSVAAAFAETHNVKTIIMGLQVHDSYGYHDTTQQFVDKVNSVLVENRIIKIKVIAPFSDLSKTQELELLRELDGNLSLLEHTLTCYNPDEHGNSCGNCPSCSERIHAFLEIGEKDPIPYLKSPWS